MKNLIVVKMHCNRFINNCCSGNSIASTGSYNLFTTNSENTISRKLSHVIPYVGERTLNGI